MYKILHVTNTYFSLPFFLGGQFLYFKNKGYEIYVICSPSPHLSDYASKMQFNYKEVEITRAITPIKDLKAILSICKYIKKNKIDIVVGHTPKGALLSMLAALIMHVPRRIYFRHGMVYETMGVPKRTFMIFIARLTAWCATKVVVVSASVYEKSIQDKLNRKEKQVILGNGSCGGIDALYKFNPVNIDYSQLIKLQTSFGIEINDFVIGYCGRLVKDKGIIELVLAFEQLQLKTNLVIKLLLVGDFEERDALPEIIIQKIKKNPKIIITGFIFNDIEYYYSLMNVFILPSYREGFPISVLEASSMQLPVLTTKATGCIDSIVEGLTGFYISNSTASICEGIILLINNKNIKKYGLNGRDFVLKYFDNRVLWPIIEKELYQ